MAQRSFKEAQFPEMTPLPSSIA
eukprot:IDg12944t1